MDFPRQTQGIFNDIGDTGHRAHLRQRQINAVCVIEGSAGKSVLCRGRPTDMTVCCCVWPMRLSSLLAMTLVRWLCGLSGHEGADYALSVDFSVGGLRAWPIDRCSNKEAGKRQRKTASLCEREHCPFNSAHHNTSRNKKKTYDS